VEEMLKLRGRNTEITWKKYLNYVEEIFKLRGRNIEITWKKY
jgi:hypothetical protein